MTGRRLDGIKARWDQQTGHAKIIWGRMIGDELLQIEGQEQKLASLARQGSPIFSSRSPGRRH